MADQLVLLDDRLLIEELLFGLAADARLLTTTYWYYRACRAAVEAAGGHMSGPFEQLGPRSSDERSPPCFNCGPRLGFGDPRRHRTDRRRGRLALTGSSAGRSPAGSFGRRNRVARGAIPMNWLGLPAA